MSTNSGPGADRYMRDAAYRHIQRKILNGELAAGALISEAALAKELGASRTPVREAIGQLTAEGFLEQVPSRGTAVVQLRRNDIIDLYELREALEVYAAGKVARLGLSDGDAVRLRELADEPLRLRKLLLKSGRARLDDAQMAQFISSDLAFHTLLIRCAGNPRILKVVNDTRILIRIFAMRRQGHSAEQLRQIHSFHRRIVDAVVKGREEEAMRLAREHIRASRQERLEAFDEWERRQALDRAAADLTPILDGTEGPRAGSPRRRS